MLNSNRAVFEVDCRDKINLSKLLVYVLIKVDDINGEVAIDENDVFIIIIS